MLSSIKTGLLTLKNIIKSNCYIHLYQNRNALNMDFSKLEKDLFGLMQKDDQYWRENDAKFRAAKQMATYEEFENIVKVRGQINRFNCSMFFYTWLKLLCHIAFNKSTQLLSFQASHLKPLEKADHVQEMYRDGAKGNSLLNPVAGCGGMSGIGKIKMEKKLNESL